MFWTTEFGVWILTGPDGTDGPATEAESRGKALKGLKQFASVGSGGFRSCWAVWRVLKLLQQRVEPPRESKGIYVRPIIWGEISRNHSRATPLSNPDALEEPHLGPLHNVEHLQEAEKACFLHTDCVVLHPNVLNLHSTLDTLLRKFGIIPGLNPQNPHYIHYIRAGESWGAQGTRSGFKGTVGVSWPRPMFCHVLRKCSLAIPFCHFLSVFFDGKMVT